MTAETSPRTLPDHGDDVFPHELVARRRVPAGHALIVMVATLALLLFLDADGLVRTAERQHRGWARSWGLTVMHPVQDISRALGLTEPRHWIQHLSGRHDATHITSTKGVQIASPTTVARPGSALPTTTVPRFRVPTEASPLHVLVAGDSLSGQLGPALGDVLAGKPATIQTDEEIGTGLARPDVVDWPTELKFDMDHAKPDVVVLMFGGNDNQDLRTSTGWVYISDYPAWKAEYQRRIAQIMNIVGRPGVSVYWVGLPVMGRPDLQRIVPDVNRMIRLEAGARTERVTFIDPNRAIATRSGRFATYLATSGGGTEAVREPDGVHLTRAGATRVARLILPSLSRTRHLDDPPPPSTTEPATTRRRAAPTTGR